MSLFISKEIEIKNMKRIMTPQPTSTIAAKAPYIERVTHDDEDYMKTSNMFCCSPNVHQNDGFVDENHDDNDDDDGTHK